MGARDGHNGTRTGGPFAWSDTPTPGRDLSDLAFGFCALFVATLVGLGFDALGLGTCVIIVYVVAVQVTALVTIRRLHCLLGSALSVALYNYFFTSPRHSLTAVGAAYPGTFAVMFVTALISSYAAMALRREVHRSHEAQRRSSVMLETNRLLQGCADRGSVGLGLSLCSSIMAAHGGAIGVSAAATSQAPDIVLLDLGLPDMDGVEVVKSVRSWSQMPIIVVSARTEDADKIRALDAGADDYLTKPFSVGELLARIRTTLRRLSHQVAEGPAPAPAFDNGELHVDFATGTASLAGRELHLTPMEYKLLCLLARNVGKVLTHQFILREVWDTTSKSDLASLRVIMGTLRKKIEEDPAHPRYIQTHVGVGYRMLRV